MSSIAADDTIEAGTARKTRSLWHYVLMFSLPLLIVVAGIYFWMTSGRTVSTDNAQVNASVAQISSEVSGRVVEILVGENQRVKKGDLLVRIDPAPYRIALMQADAAVGNAQLEIAQLQGTYQSKQADAAKSASDTALATDTLRRQQELLGRGFTTKANYDAAKAALAAARAQQSSDLASADSARAIIGTSRAGGHPQVEAAIAMREKAALDLARTEIRAPMDGIVSQADRLAPGMVTMQLLPLVSLVSDKAMWIDANFKETQLDKIRPGQRAEVEIDAIPGRKFKAHVASINAGTGSQFSLLPPQNATGNWVKVTQRVSVRVKLDETPDRPLVAGWSAHVTVHVAD